MPHLVEAGFAEAAAEGWVAGAGQGQRPLCPVPLELASLGINIYEGEGMATGGQEEHNKEWEEDRESER